MGTLSTDVPKSLSALPQYLLVLVFKLHVELEPKSRKNTFCYVRYTLHRHLTENLNNGFTFNDDVISSTFLLD